MNSKATLRLPLSALLPLLPDLLHAPIHGSRFHASKSDAIIIQSDGSRKQADNVADCFRKLHRLILDAARHVIPGQTSISQKDRVKTLYVVSRFRRAAFGLTQDLPCSQRADNEARIRGKKTHGRKKASRRSGGRSEV